MVSRPIRNKYQGKFNDNSELIFQENTYGLGHETVAVLLPGFAINW